MLEGLYHFVKNCFFLITILLIILLIYLYFNQNSMIYMPEVPNMCTRDAKQNPYGYQDPSQQDMPYEELNITTSDKVKLHGWLIKQADCKNSPTIIYFHENAGNIGFRIPLIKNLFSLLRVNIIIVSYRGFGNSEGFPSEFGIMQDAEAIVKYAFTALKEKININEIFILGRSLGGAVAIHVINELKPNIRGLIIENTFTSMSDLIDKIFPFLKHIKNYLLKNHWPTKDRIKNVKVPILFLMSAKDELIPIEQMHELYDKAENAKFKSKYIIKDGTHNESWIKAGKIYFVKFAKFLKKCGLKLTNINLDLDNYSDEEEKFEDFENEKTPLNKFDNYHSINESEFVEIDETPVVKERKKEMKEDSILNKVDLSNFADEKNLIEEVKKENKNSRVYLEDEKDVKNEDRKIR